LTEKLHCFGEKGNYSGWMDGWMVGWLEFIGSLVILQTKERGKALCGALDSRPATNFTTQRTIYPW